MINNSRQIDGALNSTKDSGLYVNSVEDSLTSMNIAQLRKKNQQNFQLSTETDNQINENGKQALALLQHQTQKRTSRSNPRINDSSVSTIKVAMKANNAQLGKFLGIKPPVAKLNKTLQQSSNDLHQSFQSQQAFNTFSHGKLLTASQVERLKIVTPQQYQVALQTDMQTGSLDTKKNRAQRAEDVRVSRTRFAPKKQSHPKTRSKSKSGANERSKSSKQGAGRSLVKSLTTEKRKVQGRRPVVQIGRNNSQSQTRTINLRCLNPNERAAVSPRVNQSYVITSQNQSFANPMMISNLITSQQSLAAINDSMVAPHAQDSSNYVNTTGEMSSHEAHKLFNMNQTNPALQGQVQAFKKLSQNNRNISSQFLQNSTFGQGEFQDMHNLADTYNFELQQENYQNIFNHAQQLSGLTTECLERSHVSKPTSIGDKKPVGSDHNDLGESCSGMSNMMLNADLTSSGGCLATLTNARAQPKPRVSKKQAKCSKGRSPAGGSNSVSRSIQSFIGLSKKPRAGDSMKQSAKPSQGGSLNHTRKDKKKDGSYSFSSILTDKTIEVKPSTIEVRRETSSFQQVPNNQHSHQNEVTKNIQQLVRLLKQKQQQKADRFYFETTVRKYFCIWIEKFIERIRKSKLTTIRQETKETFTKSQSEIIKNKLSSRKSGPVSMKSGNSNGKVNILKEVSNTTFPQTFLDEIQSPRTDINCTSSIGLRNVNYLRSPKGNLQNSQKLVSKLKDSTTRKISQNDPFMNNKDVNNPDQRESQTYDYFARHDPTRNGQTNSTAENKVEFRQTAQLGGNNLYGSEMMNHISVVNKQIANNRIKEGLMLISKFGTKMTSVNEKKRSKSSCTVESKSGKSVSQGRSRSNSSISGGASQKNVGVMSQTLASYRRSPALSSIEPFINRENLAKSFNALNRTQNKKKERPFSVENVKLKQNKSQSRSAKRNKSVLKERKSGKIKRAFFIWHKNTLMRRDVSANKNSVLNKSYQIFDSETVHDHKLRMKGFKSLKVWCVSQQHERDIFKYLSKQSQKRQKTKFLLLWIKEYNFSQHHQKQNFLACQHWMMLTQAKVYGTLKQRSYHKRMHKLAIRQYFPTKCLLILLKNFPSVPQDLETGKFMGQEMFECTKYIKMSWIDQTTLISAYNDYTLNIKRMFYQALKENYITICSFKAKIAMKIASKCIALWKTYAQKKAYMKFKFAQLAQRRAFRLLQELIPIWRQMSRKRGTLRRNYRLFCVRIYQRTMIQAFNILRQFSILKRNQHVKRMRADHFYHLKLKYNLLANLITYNNHKTQKKMQYSSIQDVFDNKLKQKCFAQLVLACKLMSKLNSISSQVQVKHESRVKKHFLKEWRFNLNVSQQLTAHYEFKLKCIWFKNLKEAVVQSLMSKELNQIATLFWTTQRKQQLINFLREFKYEQDAKRKRHLYLLELAGVNRLKLLFESFRHRILVKQRNKQLKKTLASNRAIEFKIKTFKALMQNVSFSIEIEKFARFVELKFKQEMFDRLLYVTCKQKILREALISTVEKRNRKRAGVFLDEWRKAAIFKFQHKQSLNQRQHFFTMKRVIRQVKLVVMYSDVLKEINVNVQALQKVEGKKRIFSAFARFPKSKYALNHKKANFHLIQKLKTKVFEQLKQIVYFCRKQKKVQQYLVKHYFKAWMKLSIATRHFRNVTQANCFKELKQLALISKHCKTQQIIIDTFVSSNLCRTALSALKRYKEVKTQIQMKKNQTLKILQTQFLKSKFGSWKVYSRACKQERQLVQIVSDKQQSRVEAHFFNYWRQTLNHSIKLKKSVLHFDSYIVRKVFIFLKKEALRNIRLEKILNNFNRQKRLKRSIFDQVKRTAKSKKEAKLKKKWNGKPPLSTKSKSKEKKNKMIQEFDAILVRAKVIKQAAYSILKQYYIRRVKARKAGKICQQMIHRNLIKRTINQMLETFVVQPQLDALGDQHFLRRNFRRFITKVTYIRERQNGTNLHEFEIRAYNALGKKLLRKAFLALKFQLQARSLKQIQEQMIFEYQCRKWFGIWRQKYLLRSQNNYLMMPQTVPRKVRTTSKSIEKMGTTKSMQGTLSVNTRSNSIQLLNLRSAEVFSSYQGVMADQATIPDQFMQRNFSQTEQMKVSNHIGNLRARTKSRDFNKINIKDHVDERHQTAEFHSQELCSTIDDKMGEEEDDAFLNIRASPIKPHIENQQEESFKTNLKRSSPGKQPKQSPQKGKSINDSDKKLLFDMNQHFDQIQNIFPEVEQEEHESEMEHVLPPKKAFVNNQVPRLHDLINRVNKMNVYPNEQSGEKKSFKAFLNKNVKKPLDYGFTSGQSPNNNNKTSSPLFSGSKHTFSGNKSNNLNSTNSLEDADLPATLYQ